MQVVIKPHADLTVQEKELLKDLHLHTHPPMDVTSNYVDIGKKSIAVIYYSVLNPLEILGWGLLDIHIDDKPVGHVFVREECRRQGIGSEILRTMQEIIPEFETLSHDRHSSGFYQANGVSSLPLLA